MTIVYIVEEFPSISEYFVLNEILGLEKQGIRIIILALKRPKRKFDYQRYTLLKSPVVYISQWSYCLCILKAVSKILIRETVMNDIKLSGIKTILKRIRVLAFGMHYANRINRDSITHIHAHFAFITTDIAIILSELLNITFSFSAHAQDIFTNQSSLINKIETASFVITCTKYNKEYLDRITKFKYHEKIHLVYHGIDIQKDGSYYFNRKKSLSPCIKIISVSRLVEKKGLVYLLKSVKGLISKGYNVTCEVIGQGPLEKFLSRKVEKLGIAPFIKLEGAQPREVVLAKIASADLLVFSGIIANNGDMDGLPNVLLEAMLVGTPSVATDISAISEAIINEETGVLAAEKDEESLVTAILKLIDDPMLYERLRRNGRRKVEQEFDSRFWITKLAAKFREAANVETKTLQ